MQSFEKNFVCCFCFYENNYDTLGMPYPPVRHPYAYAKKISQFVFQNSNLTKSDVFFF